jgi:hypothetical protein
MKPDQTIPALLQVFKTKPALFPAETLEKLDGTLDNLEGQHIYIVSKEIKDWLGKQNRQLKDTVSLFAQSFREIKGGRGGEAGSDEMLLKKSFVELQEAVKDKLNA